ncbi:MAG TPA: hypothetical protein VFS43_28280 [Polyangiaceae bacterium]|nr:hypothetical protein [Polyangiaceae bacterium]
MATEKSAAAGEGAAAQGEVREWSGEGWTARVLKNEDDDGWAVSMTRDGDPEPALVSPWVMGRDKKNPKPLNAGDFKTLLKAARDVIARHEQSERARLHKSVDVTDASGQRVRVDLDVVPDEDDPHALLSAYDAAGEQLGQARVEANWRLSAKSAEAWVHGGMRSP